MDAMSKKYLITGHYYNKIVLWCESSEIETLGYFRSQTDFRGLPEIQDEFLVNKLKVYLGVFIAPFTEGSILEISNFENQESLGFLQIDSDLAQIAGQILRKQNFSLFLFVNKRDLSKI